MSTDDPRWASGPLRFVGRPSKNVAEYELTRPSPVTLSTTAPNQVVVIHVTVHQAVTLAGDVASGTKVRLVLASQTKLVVSAGSVSLSELAVVSEHHVRQLTISSLDLSRLKLSCSADVTLSTPVHRAARPLEVTVKARAGPVSINPLNRAQVSLASVDSKTEGELIVGVPLVEKSSVSTAGALSVKGPVGRGSSLEAAGVTVAQQMPAGTVTCTGGNATLRNGVQGEESDRTTVTASTVNVVGAATRLRVREATTVTVGGDLVASDVTAARHVTVQGSVTASTIDVSRADGQATAVLVGGTYDESQQEAAFRPTEDNRLTDAIEGWAGRAGTAVTQSTIEVRGGGATVVPGLAGTSVDTDGSLLVAGGLELDDTVAAADVRCHDLDGDLERLQVPGRVHVAGVATVHGRLTAREVVVDGHLSVPDGSTCRIDAGVFRANSARTGDLTVTAGDSCVLAPSEVAADVSATGPVTVDPDDTVRFDRPTRDAVLHRSDGVPDIHVAHEATVEIRLAKDQSPACVRVRGHTTVRLPGPDSDISFVADTDSLGATVSDGARTVAEVEIASRATLTLVSAVAPVDGSSDEKPDLTVAYTSAADRDAVPLTPTADDGPEDPDGPVGPGSAGGEITLGCTHPFDNVELRCETPLRPPAGAVLNLRGPVRLTLHGAVSVLDSKPMTGPDAPHGGMPRLSVPDRDTRVTEARGPLVIAGTFLGRIHGPPRHRRLPWQKADDVSSDSLRVVGIDLDDGHESGGALIDIDPTELGYADLQALRAVQVVDATRGHCAGSRGPAPATRVRPAVPSSANGPNG